MSEDKDASMSNGERKYWYNTDTRAVEFGYISPAVDRVGPFDTEEQAANAMQTLRERSDAWAAEDAIDEDWRNATETDGK